MSWNNLLSKWFRQTSNYKNASRKPKKGRKARLTIEELENRVVPSTLNLTGGVLAYADGGAVSSNAFSLTLSGSTYTIANTENFASITGIANISSGGTGSTSVSFPAAGNSFASVTLSLQDTAEAVDTAGITLTNQNLSITSTNSGLALNGSITSTTGNISATTTQNGLNPITVNPSTSITTAGGTVTLTAPDGITDNGAIGSSTTGAIGINGPLSGGGNIVTGTANVTDTQATNSNFSGVISGGFGLDLEGAGTLGLSGTNTYSGSTTVNAGTLQLGAAPFTVPNSSFETPNVGGYQYSPDPTLASWTFTSCGIEANGGAFGAPNAPDGVQAAFLQNQGNFSQSINFPTAGTYTVSFMAAWRGGAGGVNEFNVLIDGTSYADITPASSSAFNPYSTSSFTVTAGLHTVEFLGLDTGGGDRTSFIDQVAIRSTTPPASNLLPVTTGVTVAAGATLDLNGTNQAITTLNGAASSIVTDSNSLASTLTVTGGGSFSGNLTGTGLALTLNSASNATLILAGANTYGGATTINNANTLQVGSITALSGGNLTDNGTLDLNGNSNSVAAFSGSGSVVDTAGAATLTVNNGGSFSGNISGANTGLSVAGALTLSGADTYGGSTTITITGTLQAGSTTALSSASRVTGHGTLNLNGNNSTIGSLSGAGSVVLGAGTLSTGADNTNTTFTGAISGAGGLTKVGSGIFTFSGEGTYAGSTTVSNTGTLQLGGDFVPAPAPVAYYAFNGNTNDSSGNGNNGTFVGGSPTYVTGQFGQALSFNGSQVVQIPYSSSLANLNSFTVSAWVNMPAGFSGDNGILGTRFGGDTTFDVKVSPTHIHGDVGDGTNWINTAVDLTGPAGQVPTGIWNMITYVVDNANQQFLIYVNGSLANTIGFTGTPLFMKTGQTLGIGEDYPGEFLNGAIDDVFVYGQALSDSQISSLYTHPGSGAPLPTTTNVSIASGATLDLNGISQAIGSLSGSGAVTNTSSATPATLTVNGGGSFSGAIHDGSSTVALTVGGASQTLTLSGTNTNTGQTTVASTDTLVVDGSETSAVSVQSGGTLGGTGTTGALTVSGGTVNAGDPVSGSGALTAHSADFSSGGNLTVDITGTSTVTSDSLAVTNNVTLGGTSTLTVDLNGLATLPTGPITVVSDGSQSGQFSTVNVVNNPNGYGVNVSYTSNSVVINVVSVPPTVTSLSPAFGSTSGGTSVNIFGTGFLGATAVHFGGVGATSFTVVSGTEITAVAPIGTGVVDVTVTGPLGTSAITGADQLTYVAPPVITPDTTNLPDVSSTITINGSGFSTTPAQDAVAFNLGVTGTVMTATANQLIVQISTPPTALGALTANVTTYGAVSSGLVQVGNVINGDWVVADSSGTAGGGSLTDITLPYAVSHALSGDTITFASTLSGSTITLTGVLAVHSNISITGPGAANLTVSGNNAVGDFSIASGVTASISGLTITGGSASTGGGIVNSGILTLSNDVISGNAATGVGGDIFNGSGATLVASDASVFTSSTAVNDFGTIDLHGNSESIGGLSGSGLVTSSSAGAMTLTVGGGFFTGVIQNGIAGATVSLDKAGAATLYLGGANTYTGTTQIDAGTVQLVSAGGIPVLNASFEAPNLGYGGYQYSPSGVSWTFTSAGIQANGSAWGAPSAPDGAQTAFLQNQGTFSQSINFPAAGAYTVSFLSAWRSSGVANDFNVLVDGVSYGHFTPASSSAFNPYSTSSFSVSAGFHTVEFLGLDTAGGGNTAFVDEVSIASTTAPAPGNILPAGTALTLAGGALDLNGFNQTIGSLSGGGSVRLGAATLTTGADNTNTTFSGAIGGAGSLTKVGTGTFTFSGAGTYGGSTTVSSGTLKLGSNSPLPTPAAQYLFNGDTTDSSGNGNNGTFSGVSPTFVSGPFGVGQAISFDGTQSVSVPYSTSLANLNSYTVSAWVNMPTGFGDGNGILGTRFGADTTFDVKVMAHRIHGDFGSGSGWLNTSADITGAAGQVPAGVWTMITYVIDNANQHADLYVDGALANVIGFSGTPLFMTSAQTMNIGEDYPGEFLTGAIADVNVFGSALSGSQVGSLYTQFSGLLPSTTNVSIASGATLDLNGVSQQVAGVTGSGSVIDSTATHAAVLTVTGTAAPGTAGPGALATGNIVIPTGSTFAVDLNGLTPVTQYDQLAVTGTATLGGALSVNLGSFAPQLGNTFDIIQTTGGVIGTFSQGSTYSSNGYTYSINYAGGTGHDVVLTVTAVPSATTTTLTDNGPNPSTFGNNVSFTATVTGGTAITGQTVFIEDADASNAVVASPTLSGGTVTFNISSLTVGTHHLFAVYNGDATHASSNSSLTPVAQVVNGGGAAPAVSSVVVNGGPPAYTDGNGLASPNLAGQNSVVEQILVTFNEAVTLDAGAFTITNNAALVTVNNGPTPNTAAVSASFAVVPLTGNTEFIVTFSGPGTTAIPSGTGSVIKDGLYTLNTIGSHVHANSQTAADNNTKFWALYGSVVGADNNLSSNLGDGTSEVFVDNFDYSAFKTTFGSETDIPTGIPYNVGLDGDLNGFVDNFDYSEFKGNFGADWSF